MSAAHPYATFGLAPVPRAGAVLPGGAHRAHRESLDFVVDGRPLLLRLAELDAVSPLAADVGPSVFPGRARRLLPGGRPPPADGRYLLYGCPECDDWACGAVTAVIEQDGADIVWRDFAWQTGEAPDPDRGGYPGLGPFRFRGEEYRAVLERLLAGDAPPAARRRVLLVGRRADVLADLTAALRTAGICAETRDDAAGAPAEELRSYGAVAFGRRVPEQERIAIRSALEAAGSHAVHVEGLAPVVPLLVAQLEQALDDEPVGTRLLTELTADPGGITVGVAAPCQVQIVVHRLDRFYRARTHELFDGPLEAGRHPVPAGRRELRGRSFVVARAGGTVLVAPVRQPAEA